MRPSRVFLALSLLFIGSLTLLPNGPEQAAAWSCIVCGDRGTADVILNIALFAPLGAALILSGAHARRAIIIGGLLSAAIELAQIWIPGRDSSIGDVLSNTLGTAVGVALVVTSPYWLLPAGRRSRLLALAWTAGAVLVAWGTVWLLQPSLPRSLYYGQWTHDLGGLEWYRGHVLEAEVGPVSVPDGPSANSESLRGVLAAAAPIVVRATAGPPIPRLGPLFSIADEEQRSIVMLGPDRGDLVYHIRTRAEGLRLDAPNFVGRGLMAHIASGDSLRVSVTRQDDATCLTVNGRRECGLAFGPEAGWSLLEYERHWPPWLMTLFDVGWLICLAAPIGYWGGRGAVFAFGGVLAAAVVSAAWYGGTAVWSSALWAIAGVAFGAAVRLIVARRLARWRPGVATASRVTG